MPAHRFLKSLEKLSYVGRRRAVIRAVRDLEPKSPARVGILCAELADGDRYSREVALQVAVAGGLTAVVTSFLADADGDLRTSAAAALPRMSGVDADTIVSAYECGSPRERRALLRAAVGTPGAGPVPLAEPLLHAALRLARQDDAAWLLPWAAPARVAELMGEIAPLMPTATVFAMRHPDLFVEHLARELAGLPARARVVLWHRREGAVAELVRRASDDHLQHILRLIAAHPPSDGWSRGSDALWSALVRRSPGESARILAAQVGATPPRLSRRASRRLVEDSSAAVIDLLHEYEARDAQCLEDIVGCAAPRVRWAVTRRLVAGRSRARLSLPRLDSWLPRALRIEDARVGCAEAAATGASLSTEAARLPLAESRPILGELTTSSVPTERGRGYQLLIRSAIYEGSAAEMTALLGSFTRLRNEQEPVRLVALQALAEVPLRLLREDAIPFVLGIATDAVAARDHSHASATAIRSLATRILLHSNCSHGWRSAAVVMLRNTNGTYFLTNMSRMSKAAADDLVAALSPVLREHAEHNMWDVLFTVVRALGRAGWEDATLIGLLNQATRSKQTRDAQEAFALLLRHPATRMSRLRTYLAAEPSLITAHIMAEHVTRNASDLLTTDMLRGVVRGRFRQISGTWLLPGHHARRWTGPQRAVYAAHVGALADRPQVDQTVRFRAVIAASFIPEYDRSILRRWAAPDAPLLIRELALGRLGECAADAAGDDLLCAALSIDEARVAGAALVRRAGILRPVTLRPVLAAAWASAPKITAQKSIVWAETRAAQADTWQILAALRETDPHRDVVQALASAALRSLSNPVARDMATADVGATDRGPALLEGLRPAALPASQRALLGDALGAVLVETRRLTITTDGHQPAGAERAARTRGSALRYAPHWAPYSGLLRAEVWSAVRDAEDTAHDEAVGGAVAALLEAGQAAGLVDAVRTLLAADAAYEAGGQLTDEPRARQRLEALASLGRVRRGTVLPHESLRDLHEVVELLLEPRDYSLAASALALDLLVETTLPPQAAVSLLGRALGGRGSVAVEAGQRIRSRDLNAVSERRLERAFELLRGGREPEVLVALAIVGVLGERQGWPDAWQVQLAGLRCSPHGEVRERALRQRVAR